jgi:serine/threonine protein kinase
MSGSTSKFTCPFCKETHYTFITKCPRTKEAVPAVYRFKGRVLEGKYEVLDLIGEGGMGVVYEGKHKLIGKKIAIKFLYLTSRASKEMIARFQNEARIAASIAHKNIVEVLDMGTSEEGVHYTVMAYLDGHPLADMLPLAPLPESKAIKIAVEILSGLNAVHSKKITHRDIKPANIFIVEQAGGEQLVKILDFGISHLAQVPGGDALLKTKTGTIFGTPKYMSPEQARGDRKVDARSDLYSVGVILYELLTGRVPFDADNYNELIVSIILKDPVPPSVLNPKISPEIEKIVLTSLAKEPDARFQTAAEFAAYLSIYRPYDEEEEMPSVVTHLPPELLEKIRSGIAQSAPGLAGPSTPGFTRTPSKPIVRRQSLTPPTSEGIATDLTLPGVATPVPQVISSITPKEFARTAPRKSKSRWIMPAAAAALALLIPSTVFLVVFLAAGGRKDGGAVKALSGPVSGTALQGRQVENINVWKVTLKGTPKGAAVYVDGVLHPETPLLLERSAASKKIRIEAGNYKAWEESVAVRSDVTIPIKMNLLSAQAGTGTEPAARDVDKKQKKKKGKSEIETAGAGNAEVKEEAKDKKKSKIDVVFPGLQKQ